MAKFKLRWLEGIILARFGSTRLAERRMLVAKDGLVDLGATYEVALISLDILSIYIVTGEPPDVIQKLASEAYELFQDMSRDEEALAALLLLAQAAEENQLTGEILRTVRETVARLTKPAV